MKNIGRILALCLFLANFYVVVPASASITGVLNEEVQSVSESALDPDVVQKRDSMKSLQTQAKSVLDDTTKKLFEQALNPSTLPQAHSQTNASESTEGLTKLQATVPDVWETEPNGSNTSANPIVLDARVLGNFSSYSDKDYFKIVIPQAGTLKLLGMAGDESGSYSPYYTLGLYDTYGTNLDWTTDDTVQGVQTQYVEVKVARGTYYIRGMTWDPATENLSSKIVGQTYRFIAYMASTDTTPPTVIAQDYDNATNVPVGANFYITYDKAVQIIDPSQIYFYEWNTYKVLRATSAVNGAKLSITPVSNFLSQTKYMINIDKGAISDSSGNIPEDYYYSFTTGASTLTLPDGSVYIGEISNNKPNGQGTMTFPNGTKYVGQFVDGLFNGQGTMTWTNGQKYVGQYQNGARNGQGVYTWPNGSKFIGQYQNNKRNGQGTMTYSNGTIEIGTWQDDVFMDSTVRVSLVSLNKRNISLITGNTETLTATIYPSDASNQDISWSSSNGSVAKVDYNESLGVATVRAIGPGQSVITVTTLDGGLTDLCTVNVTKPDDVDIKVTSVKLNKRNLTLTVGKTEKLQATIAPANATNRVLAWVSNNKTVAEVDATGVVKAVGPGQARITLISADGGKTDYCDVEVKKQVTEPTTKVFPVQSNVPVEKEWRVKFNSPINSNTLQSNIVLWRTETNASTQTTVNAEEVTIVPVIDSTDSTVAIVKHTTPFVAGASYKLIVKDGVKNLSGSSLANSASLEFSTLSSVEEFTSATDAFSTGGTIPVKYGLTEVPNGKNISLPLEWEGVPVGTKSLAVFMYDLHPIANNWVHWAVINIPVTSTGLVEGASGTSSMPADCIELINDFGSRGYGGPCPPSGTGKHEYKILVYALNSESINLSGSTSLNQFRSAISGKVLAQSEISGYFEQ